MTMPLIGITTFGHTLKNKNRAHSVSSPYSRAVAAAGGAPVQIPMGLEEPVLESIFERLDGVLFPGGGDVAPILYTTDYGDKAKSIDLDRDRLEIWLVQRLVETGKPFFGICRGQQVINVALGGSLYADISAEKQEALRHNTPDDQPRNLLIHPVEMAAGTRLSAVISSPGSGASNLRVNSLHHQAVKELGKGLVCSAVSPQDGVVEGLELPDHPFGLAVQWHPEELQDMSAMRALFEAFVAAARKH
jgi:putative glutamine amidotransferase